ncbi:MULTISPECIES: hypothetical protein [unclassified Raoultella]|uniref:hypothetical protein n=1 Tax=unclassified Raoultella TaxID=2627600 RepID=UPI00135877C5|nr:MULTISPECIES: hypothetical protein [unclassified Raoultella]MBD7016245.1 hypothetical protein [Klebsiella pneumoniae]MDQ5099912.1 hypothetical protein [Klebsiella pneumoniae]
MNKIFNNYQVNYFTNNNDVSATPPVLGMLLDKLSSLSLLPMFAQEVNAFTGEKRQIVIMTDAEQSFKIEFPAHSVIFSSPNADSEDFFRKVESAIKALKSIFPDKKSNRLAVLQSSFYTGGEEKYLDLYRKIFTHHKANPIEWENRIVERGPFDSSGEIANMVSSVRRCMIQSPMIANGNFIDVINFEVDTNTIPENTTNRFDFTSSISVLRCLLNKNNELMNEFSRYTDM